MTGGGMGLEGTGLWSAACDDHAAAAGLRARVAQVDGGEQGEGLCWRCLVGHCQWAGGGLQEPDGYYLRRYQLL